MAFILIACQQSTELIDAAVENAEVGRDRLVEEYEGKTIATHDVIYTLDEVLSLTFDRILPKKDIMPLLEQLDEANIKVNLFCIY